MLVVQSIIKLTKSDYNLSKQSNVLYEPEVAFPSKKLLKQVDKKKTTTKKVSKKDFLLSLTRMLDGKYDGNKLRIPLQKLNTSGENLLQGYRINLSRVVFLRQGHWNIDGIFKVGQEVSRKYINTAYFETPKIRYDD